VRREDPFRVVTLGDGTEISCHALVLATGVAVRKLDVPGADQLTGIGVYYGAAVTELAFYREQDIAIVGGGNSAGQAALFFARYAKTVAIIIRAADFSHSMSQYLIDRIAAAPNINVLAGKEVRGVTGDAGLENILLRDRDTQADAVLPMAAMFVFIGAAPHTELVADIVQRNDKDFILTGPDLKKDGNLPKGWTLNRDPFLYETSVPGIFAAGDVRAGSSKRVAAAVGEGSGAIGVIHRYLETV
jgi:thioredoxin reductase (NADPH)